MIHPETDPKFTGIIHGKGPIGPLEFIENTFREGKTLEAIGDGKTLKNSLYGDYMLFAPPCFTSSNYEKFKRQFELTKAAIRKIESPRPKSPKLQPHNACLKPPSCNMTMAQHLRLKQEKDENCSRRRRRRRRRRGCRGGRNRTRNDPHVNRTARTFGMYLQAAQRRV